MITFPARPDAPDASGTAPVSLRFEDVSQEGRVRLEAFSHGIGEAVWRALLSTHPAMEKCIAQGILPILTRLVIEGAAGPFSVDKPLAAFGCYQNAHTIGADGGVDRLVMNMWADLSGPLARTYDPQPEDAGEVRAAGRVFAEHVYTRLWGASESRKVRRLELPGLPEVPPVRYVSAPFADILAMPTGAAALDAELQLDPALVVFGLAHTDSNQHVNSLVYPRLFEEAALRRFAALGRPTALLARAIEVGFRKPFFGGESARIALRAFEDARGLGAVGVFLAASDAVPDGDLTTVRPHTFVCMRFEP